MKRYLHFLLALAFALPWASRAVAADDIVAARASFERAQRNYDLREYTAALADFKEAYRARPDPVLLFNIAQCHRKLGRGARHLPFTVTT